MGFESVDQRQHVAACFTGMAVDLLGNVLSDSQISILAVAAGFVEYAFHAVFTGVVLRRLQSVVHQHKRQRCILDEFIDVAHVTGSGVWTRT